MSRKWVVNIILVLMIGLLILGFYNPFRIRKIIKKDARYTVGYVYKESGSLKNGEHYHYKFSYHGKEVDDYMPKGKQEVAFGDRFIVEFSSQDPDYSTIHYEWPVNKEFGVAPDTGWKIIPRGVVVGY